MDRFIRSLVVNTSVVFEGKGEGGGVSGDSISSFYTFSAGCLL